MASERGWLWLEPVRLRRFRTGPFGLWGEPAWEVVSNAHSKGCSVRVVFDDRTGDVVSSGFLSR